MTDAAGGPSPAAEAAAPAVLAAAADLIEGRGWAQGEHEDAAGRLCMLGAIRAAVYGAPVLGAADDPRFGLALAAERLAAARCGRDLTGFNDSAGRTRAEVLAVLRAEGPG